MKKLLKFVKVLSFSVLLLLMSGIIGAVTLESLEGSWLGVLEVGSGKELDIAIVFAKNQDNAIFGTFKILEQGDLPVDEILLDKTTITLKVKSADFEIVGTIDMEHDSIDAKFRQGDTKIPLLLKRADVVPDDEGEQK